MIWPTCGGQTGGNLKTPSGEPIAEQGRFTLSRIGEAFVLYANEQGNMAAQAFLSEQDLEDAGAVLWQGLYGPKGAKYAGNV